MNAEEIKLLQAQNEGYRKQNESLQKENAALKGIIDAYKMSEQEANEIIAELKAYKDVNEDFKTAWEELKAENERLKEKFEIESLTDKTTGKTIYRSNLVNKLKELLELRIEDLCESCGSSSMMPMPCTVYKQTLQEIKAIAETPKPFIDFSETKTAIEVEYDYAAICKELELRLYKVLELITKAEEE